MATTALSALRHLDEVIHAEGEFQAAARLVEAAEMMRDHPVALQLRYLQAMTEMSDEG